jgi:hypothetical protein
MRLMMFTVLWSEIFAFLVGVMFVANWFWLEEMNLPPGQNILLPNRLIWICFLLLLVTIWAGVRLGAWFLGQV